jgi:hypothetical protein
MRPRCAAPRAAFGSLPARCLSLSTPAIAATLFAWQPAHAAVDDSWAGPMIDRMVTERAEPSGGSSRTRSSRPRSAADPRRRPERRAYHGSDHQHDHRPDYRNGRPARHAISTSATRHWGRSRIASLGHNIQSLHLRPLSVIEWARPALQATIPKEPGSGSQGVGPMVASLGRDFFAPPPASAPSMTEDAIKWLPTALTDCLAAPLRSVLTELAAAFGPITVRWTCRSKQINAEVGGAKRSYHLAGDAVDFNVAGNYRAILTFLQAKKEVGGLKHYGGGAFHIDTGPRRTW